MRRLLVVLVVLGAAVGVASGGYSPHWQNPLEVPEQGKTTTSLVVYTAFENSSDDVLIDPQGNISQHLTFDTREFTLSGQQGDDPFRTVSMDVRANNLSVGDRIDGFVYIRHRGGGSGGQTDVQTRDIVFVDVTVVEREGLLDIPGLGSPPMVILVPAIVLGIAVVGIVGYLRYYRGKDDSVIDWRDSRIEWEE